MGESKTSHGLQAHDIIPLQIQEDYANVLKFYLPGWKGNAEYNYDVRSSTAIGAKQLGGLKHLGPHEALNGAIKKYIDDVMKLPESERAVGCVISRTIWPAERR